RSRRGDGVTRGPGRGPRDAADRPIAPASAAPAPTACRRSQPAAWPGRQAGTVLRLREKGKISSQLDLTGGWKKKPSYRNDICREDPPRKEPATAWLSQDGVQANREKRPCGPGIRAGEADERP